MIHKKLEVYRLSIDRTVSIYEITKRFPESEKYGLISQIRRAAVSIPANIAEGSGRRSTKEYRQYLYIALGSISELEALIDISKQVGFIKTDLSEIEFKLYRIRRGIHAILKNLNTQP